jgi:hypothetical protein
MKKAITNLIFKNVQNKYKNLHNIKDMFPNMINYLGPSYSGCYNNNNLYNDFDIFNVDIGKNPIIKDYANSIDSNNEDEGEIIFRLIFTDTLFSKKEITTTSTTYHKTESKIKTIEVKGFNLDSTNTSLIVFTVINLTDGYIPGEGKPDSLYVIDEFNFDNIPYSQKKNGKIPSTKGIVNIKKKLTNNIPNPPFININKLKQAVNIIIHLNKVNNYFTTNKLENNKFITFVREIQNKFNEYINEFRRRVKLYEFYGTDTVFTTLIDSTELFKILNKNTFIDSTKSIPPIESLINYIEANNETTLIGTVNFFNFTQIAKDNFQYTMCDGITDNEINDNNVINHPGILAKIM